jgi:glycosyltransferase involved in cell wall biosynthesis
LAVYELRRYLQKRLPDYHLIALYIGQIQKRADRDISETLPLLQQLENTHDGQYNLFYELYLPDEIFPLAFRALDFVVIWYERATVSGRMAHALGTSACVVGRDIEGVGETLRLIGLPAAKDLEELAEKIETLVTEPSKRIQLEKAGLTFANRLSFAKQAQKHLELAKALWQGDVLPQLDLEIYLA